MKGIVYVDNNATTPVAREVFEAMRPFLTDRYGNPSSIHSFGGSVAKDIEQARESLAGLVGAAYPDEIIFTSCGTESDNAALRGILGAYPDKKHIITTKVEHPAVLNLCEHLESTGYRVTYLEVDQKGQINTEYFESVISQDTALVSIMYANNETGVVFPIREMAEIAQKKGVIFHSDAVQAIGKVPLDLTELPVDLLSLSGHKIHGPKGIGALYLRKGTRFSPFLIGGHQEKNRRGGTENVAAIVGLGVAAELAKQNIKDQATRVKSLRDKLENYILENILDTRVNGARQERLPNTSNISFKFVEGESILLLLDEKKIAASSGSACTSGSLSPSHVLKAMGVPFEFIQGSVRFSLSCYNNEKEIDYITENITEIMSQLRKISPFGRSH